MYCKTSINQQQATKLPEPPSMRFQLLFSLLLLSVLLFHIVDAIHTQTKAAPSPGGGGGMTPPFVPPSPPPGEVIVDYPFIPVIVDNALGGSSANPGLSCLDLRMRGARSQTAVYWIKPRYGIAAFQVLCDQLRDGGGWAMIESFSHDNNAAFRYSGFMDNLFSNEAPSNLAAYRMPRFYMTSLFTNAAQTEWRALCGDPVSPIVQDYIYGRLSSFNILEEQPNAECRMVSSVNVRGVGCSNCQVLFTQVSGQSHLQLVSSYPPSCDGLDFTMGTGIVENLFGVYNQAFSSFTCVQSGSSLTNYWIRYVPICYSIPADNPSVCSGRGVCVNTDTCECLNRYRGNYCQDEPLIAYYRAEWAGADYSGSSHNGQIYQSRDPRVALTTVQRTSTTYAFSFESLDVSFAAILIDNFPLPATSDFTITMLIRLTSTSDTPSAMLSYGSGDSPDELVLKVSSSGFSFSLHDVAYSFSTKSYPTETWMHYALVKRTSQLDLYINGAIEDNYVLTGSSITFKTPGRVVLGQEMDTMGPLDPVNGYGFELSQSFHGEMDSIMVFPKALEPTEIVYLAQESYTCNPGAVGTPCNGHGTCIGPDICKCNTGYTGARCESHSCGGIIWSSIGTCGGHGTCTGPNICDCHSGYSDFNCQTWSCNNVDRNDRVVCSGHGTCTSPNQCSCASGYTGNDCQTLTCWGISFNDAEVCSRRGACVGPDKCECEGGYSGNDCSYPICFGTSASSPYACSSRGSCSSPDKCICNNGYTGNECEDRLCFGVSESNTTHVCSGHGTCTDIDTCTCSSDYTGDECEIPICNGKNATDSSVCSGHGTCEDGGKCKCQGYTGDDCEYPICLGVASNDPNVCSGRGTCAGPDDCVCVVGEYTGANCETPICDGLPATDITVCSGRGFCTSPNVCSCSPGYTGSRCNEKLCFGVSENNLKVCSGHGTCSDVDTCTCSSSYTGLYCEIPICNGKNATDSTVCSGRGTCMEGGICQCDLGYSQASFCEYPTCFGKSGDDTTVCSGRGWCVLPDVCACPEGYGGRECQDMECFGISATNMTHVCSGRGSCVGPNVCSNCIGGYTGSQCQNPICYGIPSPEPTVCSGHGTCVAPNTCRCQEGYTVGECREPICFRIPQSNSSVCSGYGICTNPNICVCDSRHSGPNCSQYTGKLPALVLVSTYISGSLFNRNRAFKVVATLSPLSELPLVSIEWQLHRKANNGSIIKSDNLLINRISNNISLAIPENSFLPSAEYILTVKASYLEYMSAQTTRTMTIFTSSPPVLGTIQCSPPNGTADTDFVLSADKWEKDVLLSFQYYDNSTKMLIPLTTFSTITQIRTKLPLLASHRVQVYVVAKNVAGETVSVFTTVPVLPIDPKKEAQYITEQANNLSDETDAAALANIILQQANRPSGGGDTTDKKATQDAVEKIVTFTSSLLTSDSSTDGTQLNQRISIIEIVVRNDELVPETTRHVVLDTMKEVLNFGVQGKNFSSAEFPFQTIANVISNIAGSGFSNPSLAPQIKNTTNSLATALLFDLLPNEDPTSIVSSSFEIKVRKQNIDMMRGSAVLSDSNPYCFVQIPSLFGEGEDGMVFSHVMTVYTSNPYQYAGNSQNMAAPVIEFEIQQVDGSEVSVKNQTDKFIIALEKKTDSSSGETSCRYWSEKTKDWSTDGVVLISENSTHIICASEHLTSFSAFILYSKKDTSAGRHASGLAFNGLFILICVPILLVLIFLHKHQPVKSRFIAPYLGITAIIVDAVLQGIIRNSLLISEQDIHAVNSFSYLIMVSTNPLTTVALFVYLWQAIRYILFCNIYHIMSKDDRSVLKRGIVRTTRVFTSKLLYLCSTLAVGGTVLAYFLVLVIIAATRTTESGRVAMTDVQAISFAGIMIALGIMILIALIIDVMWALQRTPTQHQDANNENVTVTQSSRGIGKVVHLFTHDPLMFRVESLLICISIAILFVLYALGIASVSANNKALSAIVLAFEILFLFSKIAAFGGFVALLTVKTYLATRNSKYSMVKNEKAAEDAMMDLLQNPHGYQITHQYCQREFSLENLLLWKELEQVRLENLTMTSLERTKTMKQIHQTYVATNSEREVNISNSVKRNFEKAMNAENPSASDVEAAYANLYTAIMVNISDTLSRMMGTPEYEHYLSTRKLELELKDTVV